MLGLFFSPFDTKTDGSHRVKLDLTRSPYEKLWWWITKPAFTFVERPPRSVEEELSAVAPMVIRWTQRSNSVIHQHLIDASGIMDVKVTMEVVKGLFGGESIKYVAHVNGPGAVTVCHLTNLLLRECNLSRETLQWLYEEQERVKTAIEQLGQTDEQEDFVSRLWGWESRAWMVTLLSYVHIRV